MYIHIDIFIYRPARPKTCVYVCKDVYTDWSRGTRDSLTALAQKGKDRPRRPKWHHDISR